MTENQKAYINAQRWMAVFLTIFLLTAWLSLGAAYSPEQAWNKWWWLVVSVLGFIVVGMQPRRAVNWSIWIFSLCGVGISLYFLFSNDWIQAPAKIAWLNQIGLWWMRIRPLAFGSPIYHNSAAGLIVYTLPFMIYLGLQAWRRHAWIVFLIALIQVCIAGLGLLFTTSRGALLAFVCGGIVWIFFQASINGIGSFTKGQSDRLRALLLLLLIIAAGIIFIELAGPVSLAEGVPVLTNSGSRLTLFRDSIKIIEDFPWTGAGLGSFSGVYSNTILSIPNYYLPNAHNLFLNVAIEQGILGAVALGLVYLIIIIRLIKQKDQSQTLITGAVLASLVIIGLHNLVENIVDESFLIPVLFLVPGYALVVTRPDLAEPYQSRSSPLQKRSGSERAYSWKWAPGVVALLILLVVGWSFRQPLLSSWYADLGAVEMEKVVLENFPDNQWNKGKDITNLAPAEANFLLSLQYNPANRTSNHRLGLIAIMRLDFPTAIAYLQQAYQVDPYHRGIIKNLGYAYTWAGQFDQALPLLQKIPEAAQELDAYAWWWTTQNREDLSRNAVLMVKKLSESGSVPDNPHTIHVFQP